MRIKTPINKEKIKNHMTYHGWAYVLVAVVAALGWNLVYTVTAPRVPDEKRIDLYVLSSTTSSEIVDSFLKPLWEEYAPEMESVSSVVIGTYDDYATPMQLSAYVAAGEGDIYFLTETYFKSLAGQGALLSLDELVENGAIDASGVDLVKGYVTYISEYDENDTPIGTDQHLYGIPLESFYGYMSGMQIDNRSLYAAILINNRNDENVIPFFDVLLQAGRGEKPDWIE